MLKEKCTLVKLKRVDHQKNNSELTLAIEIKNYQILKEIKEKLAEIDESYSFTFMDLKGLLR